MPSASTIGSPSRRPRDRLEAVRPADLGRHHGRPPSARDLLEVVAQADALVAARQLLDADRRRPDARRAAAGALPDRAPRASRPAPGRSGAAPRAGSASRCRPRRPARAEDRAAAREVPDVSAVDDAQHPQPSIPERVRVVLACVGVRDVAVADVGLHRLGIPLGGIAVAATASRAQPHRRRRGARAGA